VVFSMERESERSTRARDSGLFDGYLICDSQRLLSIFTHPSILSPGFIYIAFPAYSFKSSLELHPSFIWFPSMDAFAALLAGNSRTFEQACARRVAEDRARIDAASTESEKLILKFRCGQISRQQLDAETKKKRKLEDGRAISTKSENSSSVTQIQPVVVQLDLNAVGGSSETTNGPGSSSSSSTSTAMRSLPFKASASTSSSNNDWMISEVRTSKASMPHLIRLVNNAKKQANQVVSKQNQQSMALASNPERFTKAFAKVTTRPGSSTEDSRVKAYLRCMFKLGEHTDYYKCPFPVDRQRALAFFTAICGDGHDPIYATADDYLWTTLARLRAIPGAYALKEEDRVYIGQVVSRQKRAGKFQHTQAKAILLEEIVEVFNYDKLLASVVAVAFFTGLRRNTLLNKVKFGSRFDYDEDLDGPPAPEQEDPPSDTEDGGAAGDLHAMDDEEFPPAKLKNTYDQWCGDFFYNERSENFCLDLEGYVLKSNLIRKVYVKCLCKSEHKELRQLCLHNTLEVITKAKTDFRKSFIPNFSKFFGTTRTQSMRIGCLQHLMGADIPAARVACHLRWSSNNMTSYYNRGNDYRDHDLFKESSPRGLSPELYCTIRGKLFIPSGYAAVFISFSSA